ncbi:MAG: DUF4339 domain-containing protein, partial [Chthoniobacterales bacterium]|nr:DUF4339 domain-containing protein [Chthoniobacterales bacterium]
MKKIFIARNRQQIGAFDVEEVRTGLSKGKFLPDDLAWREGLPSWMPLSKLLELEEESQFSTSHPLS